MGQADLDHYVLPSWWAGESVSLVFGDRMRASVKGFLNMSDLQPRTSCDSHECCPMTWTGPRPRDSFGLLFLLSRPLQGEGTWGHIHGLMTHWVAERKSKMELRLSDGSGPCGTPTLWVCECP